MLTDKQIKEAIDQVWVNYPSASVVNLPAMSAMVHRLVGTSPQDYKANEETIRAYIIANYTVVKGRNGGIMNPNRIQQAIQAAKEMAAYTPPSPTEAINDHTCPCCGNNRCSKSERTCWKCGGNLH